MVEESVTVLESGSLVASYRTNRYRTIAVRWYTALRKWTTLAVGAVVYSSGLALFALLLAAAVSPSGSRWVQDLLWTTSQIFRSVIG